IDEEDTDEDVEQKLLARKKRRKVTMIVLGSILGLILIAYFGFVYFFSNHLLFNTSINGTDFSVKNKSAIVEHMVSQVDSYKLDLMENTGNTEVINGQDIALEYVDGGEIDSIIDDQNAFLWFMSLFEDTNLETPIGVKYDESKLQSVFNSLNCLKEENQTDSVSAHPEFKDTQFVVASEVYGTKIDTDVFKKEVESAINGFLPELDLTDVGCYVAPKYTSDSKEVKDAVDSMNSYLGAEITYDFNPNTEVVNAAKIAEWVTVDGDMNVTFNEASVREYITELSGKYDTKGKTVTHNSISGRTVEVGAGSFGWQINQDAEYEALLSNIKNAEVVTREPNYSYKGVTHEGSGVGQTYVEVDLTNQVMYYVVNGALALESAIITGNPNKGDTTPSGAYFLYNKERNRTLRGPKQPDGSYEWESPVSYWMPFNGAIGLHDATWQSSFGGSLYLTRGSRGCVNMPLSAAGQLFEMIQVGTPVLCYY
ncbi:MAG: L,D-transpeptidase/peptidoglycan binding protein, partial [Suipraeoptans sp.]